MTGVQRTGARRVASVLLVAIGALAVIDGLITGVIAKASADRSAGPNAPMQTLPVHAYATFVGHLGAPDYEGLWVSLAVAALGAILIVAGIGAGVTEPRPPRPGHGTARA